MNRSMAHGCNIRVMCHKDDGLSLFICVMQLKDIVKKQGLIMKGAVISGLVTVLIRMESFNWRNTIQMPFGIPIKG